MQNTSKSMQKDINLGKNLIIYALIDYNSPLKALFFQTKIGLSEDRFLELSIFPLKFALLCRFFPR